MTGIIITLVLFAVGYTVGVEANRISHKRKVERNYEEYKKNSTRKNGKLD